MATERTITTSTGWLTLRISDESPWKEEVLDVLCEEALRRVLVKLRLQCPDVHDPYEGEPETMAMHGVPRAGTEGAAGAGTATD